MCYVVWFAKYHTTKNYLVTLNAHAAVKLACMTAYALLVIFKIK